MQEVIHWRELNVGLKTRRIKAATDDDRYAWDQSQRSYIFVQYKCKLSTANPCGSNIMLLLQTWIISMLQNVGERELQKC